MRGWCAGRAGVAALTVVLIALAFGCNRSSRYKDEQDYYRADSESGKRGHGTSRAERFGQPKKKIFVMSFYNATPLGGPDLGDFAAEELLREIRSGGRAVVPENLRSNEGSGDFYSGDKVRLGALVREGRKLGVSLIIIGRIKKITYRTKGDEVGLFRSKKAIAAVDLEMRIFDVINSKELFVDVKSADSTTSHVDLFNSGNDGDPRSQRLELVRMALRSGMELFARDTGRALEKLSWEGRVAKVSGSHVYINAGKATGLSVGDILKVLTVGEDIYDPASGAYMGRAQGQPKGTLEIVDYLGADGAVAVVHSGGNFAENDIVQLY